MAMHLNFEQQRAVVAEHGPTVIKAGPGTGKTRTLIARIEHIIEVKKISPSHILALTFTRKAAAEMSERLSHLHTLPVITTFHGLAFDVLQKSGIPIDIIADQDREDIVRLVIEKQMGKDSRMKDVKDVLRSISLSKNASWIPGHARNDDISNGLAEAYDNQLKLRSLFDYDDLLLRFYQELKDKNDVIFRYVSPFLYVLIDEFQDTNRLQFETIKLFAEPKNLFVIGDPKQSIYSFRGADASIFDQIMTDFPKAQEIILQENYRSTVEIVSSSATLFPQVAPLLPKNREQGAVCSITTHDEFTEAAYIASIINAHIGGTDLLKTDGLSGQTPLRFSDIAVIYRTHQIGRQIERECLKAGIPFQVIGKGSPYEQPLIQLIGDILRYSLDRSPDTLEKIISSPLLHISRKTRVDLQSIQRENEITYIEAVNRFVVTKGIDKKEQRILSTFIKILQKILGTIKNKTVSESIHIIYPHFATEISIELQQYISVAVQYDSTGLSTFVDYLAYLEEHEFYDPRADRVTLMTIHASKGLEFEVVCICGFEEGIIPFIKKGESQRVHESIDEEKRLLYVAMTRAKRYLYFTYPQIRMKKKTIPSSFLQYISTYDSVEYIEDTAIQTIAKKVQKMKEKKSQLSLF